MKLMLDTNMLVMLCHPSGYQDVKAWFRELVARAKDAPEILISVLADYELRRAFTAAGATESLQQYDELAKHLRLVPIAGDAATKAVDLHRAHASGKRVSDADVLMLAQATIENAILVTTDQDLLHLGATRAASWRDIQFQA